MTRFRWARVVAATAALGLVAAACTGGGEDEPKKENGKEGKGGGAVEQTFQYATGMFSDINQGNTWGWLGDTTVYGSYVFANTRCSLYTAAPPSYTWMPDIAAGDWEPAVEDGDLWAVEVDIAEGAQWSDETPITADDLVFTYEVVNELQLGDNWGTWWHEDLGGQLAGVEAVSDSTVKFTFSTEPGLAVWPNDIGGLTIQPKHIWESVVEEAKSATATEDDVAAAEEELEGEGSKSEVEERAAAIAVQQALYSADGAQDVSCGPTKFEEWVEGSHATTVPNDNWHGIGETTEHYENGAVHLITPKLNRDESYGGEPDGEPIQSTTAGPYFTDINFQVYGDQSAAVLGLENAESDIVLNSLGLDAALQQRILTKEDLEVTSNPSYGYRYIGFNMHKTKGGENMSPFGDPALRDALAMQIDKELMANSVMGGLIGSVYAVIPPGNTKWYNEEAEKEFIAEYQDEEGNFLDAGARLEKAVEILKDAGYSWETEPEAVRDDEGVFLDEIKDGSRINMPDGEPMPEVNLIGPSTSYDPARATYLEYTERWLTQLGVPVKAEPLSFNAVVARTDQPQTFDLFILGFGLGSVPIPTFYDSFFTGGSAWNKMGYKNEKFDEAVDRFNAAKTVEEAYDILWADIEPTLFKDKPHLLLFNTTIVEGYRHENLTYPFVDVLDGLQGNGSGMQSTVTSAD